MDKVQDALSLTEAPVICPFETADYAPTTSSVVKDGKLFTSAVIGIRAWDGESGTALE